MRYAGIFVFVCIAFTVGCGVKSESFVKRGVDLYQFKEVTVMFTGDSNFAKEATDLMSLELIKKGFEVAPRDQVEKVLEEQKFNASLISNTKEVARVGGLLGVKAIITGTGRLTIDNSAVGDDYNVSMTANMISVADSSVLWVGSVTTGGSGKIIKSSATTKDRHEALKLAITEICKGLPTVFHQSNESK